MDVLGIPISFRSIAFYCSWPTPCSFDIFAIPLVLDRLLYVPFHSLADLPPALAVKQVSHFLH